MPIPLPLVPFPPRLLRTQRVHSPHPVIAGLPQRLQEPLSRVCTPAFEAGGTTHICSGAPNTERNGGSRPGGSGRGTHIWILRAYSLTFLRRASSSMSIASLTLGLLSVLEEDDLVEDGPEPAVSCFFILWHHVNDVRATDHRLSGAYTLSHSIYTQHGIHGAPAFFCKRASDPQHSFNVWGITEGFKSRILSRGRKHG